MRAAPIASATTTIASAATANRTARRTFDASGRRDFIASSLALLSSTSSLVLGACDAAQAQTNARALMEPEGVIEIGLIEPGRVRACPREHNCVSTSAKESDKYATPWTAPNTFRDARDAANALVDATLETIEGSKLMRRDDRSDGSTYVGFTAPGKLGDDLIEFYIKNGDDPEGALVLFRSFAMDVKYVYPFMTPIGDLGEQAKRLRRIRDALGWRVRGCDDGFDECFS